MKILIVDDEPLVRRSLCKAAEYMGHEVYEAQDGIEGLARWREISPDVVFLDILMPGMSGPNVLQEVHGENTAKVILMSAYTGEYDLKKAQSMGANLFLPKPFEDIFTIIQKAEVLVSDR